MLIDYDGQSRIEMVGKQIDKLFDELPDVLDVSICLALVNDEDKAIGVAHVVRPQMRVLSVQVPNLQSAPFRLLVFKVIESLSEEYF